jgi:hypothetical protein
LREPYLELLSNSAGIKTWTVNGQWVRDHRDPNFTTGGHYFVYDWIPFREIWISNESPEDERGWLDTNLRYERKLMQSGHGLDYARDKSGVEEKPLSKKQRKKLFGFI